jgi:hypothetical protein
MNDATVRLLLRIPASLKSKLAELAKREHRSLNSQIEILLERSVRDQPGDESTQSARIHTNRK